MKTAMRYFEDAWKIAEGEFNTTFLGKTEAIFALGNGYMGVRSASEESYLEEKRDTFVSGTFNKFDEAEVTELPNVPDLTQIEFILNDKKLNLTLGTVENYEKILDLKRAELVRSFSWKFEDVHIKFIAKRFVSLKEKHLLGQKIYIQNLSSIPLNIEMISGINGQVSNSGAQHFTEGDKKLVDGRIMQMMPTTTQSNIEFVLSTMHKMTIDQHEQYDSITNRIEMGRRKIYKKYWLALEPQSELEVTKYSTIYTSIDQDIDLRDDTSIKDLAIEKMITLSEKSYDSLQQESSEEWEKEVWNVHPIMIESSNKKDQLAIHFAKYHLHIMTPAHDERMNIGAKGLTGEGYKGHTFWDTEIFMLPYFTFTHPDIAKKLVTYRYLGLEGARKKALKNGYEGAQFPWEAAWPADGETTPVWGAADIITGEATKIWSGFIEQHITSDVTFGVKQYMDVTGDIDFARHKGYEIIFETAKFWLSRLEWNETKRVYEILDVIGPDEYKEHVNNNAYTNYTAYWNINYAINLCENLKQNDANIFEILNQKLDLVNLIKNLKEIVGKIYLPEPNSEKVIPQDDTYLNKKIIDLTKYKNDQQVGTLFHDYNLEQVNEMQITKQADVLLLIFLFESLFEKEEKLINWNYYEPKTMHDSSLSLSTHAILAADLSKIDESYDLFQKAISIDMGENMKSSDEGIHAASLGGIWQSIVYGYGGIRNLDGILRIEPHLPHAWEKLTYSIEWHGNVLKVTVEPTSFIVENLGNQDLEFISKSMTHQIAKNSMKKIEF